MTKQLLKLTRVEALLMLREPMATFFILIFPLLVLFVFGSIFGNEPFPGSTLGAVDVSTPGYMAMVIGTTAKASAIGANALPSALIVRPASKRR